MSVSCFEIRDDIDTNIIFIIFEVVIGSIFDTLNILFSCFIIVLFFRHRVLKFIDLYLSRQACEVNLSFIRVTGKLVSFSLRDLERGGVGGG